MDTQWYRVRFYEVHALDLRVIPENRLLLRDTFENLTHKETKEVTGATRSPLLKPLPSLASVWNEIVTGATPHEIPRTSNHDRAYEPNMIMISTLPNQGRINTLIKNIQKKINIVN